MTTHAPAIRRETMRIIPSVQLPVAGFFSPARVPRRFCDYCYFANDLM
jgi:hypothetical protein